MKIHNNKQPNNKLAGKETSLPRGRGHKSESNPLEVSKEDYIRSHVEHFVLCLRDAFGFRDPMEVVSGVTKRLLKFFPDFPIEKVFKWFYGNSLAWSTSLQKDLVSLPQVDNLGFQSTSWYDACKIFGGRLMVFLQKFFRRQENHTNATASWKRRKEAFSKAQTFLMFKKGSPQVSEQLLEEANRKHLEAMTNTAKALDFLKEFRETLKKEFHRDENGEFTKLDFEQIQDWADEANFVEEEKLRIQQKIIDISDKLVDIIFKPGAFKRTMKKTKTLFPSSSAHSDKGASIQKGGAVGLVGRHFIAQVGELDRMSYHPRTGVRSHYKVTYPHAPDTLASELLESEFNAKPVHLREPLKVRTITKGPSVPYWFLLPVQKFLWSTLLKFPVFELIGNPISSEILNKMLPFAGEGESWLSGDYSAATDNLAKWLIERIWAKISLRTGMPDMVYELGLKGLTGHTLHYKDRVVVQQNGQLMGSPLSFPLLCLCNAAICLLAFKKNRRNFFKCPMRINGDDCVMSYTEREREKWRTYANFIGMVPSPGKCYFAKDWLQMNSELFILRKGSFKHINFINFSLASPYLAKGGEERTIESLSQTMQSFCFGKSEKFVDIWMRRMTPYLKKKVPGLISWYLPQCLGGLGLMSNKMGGDIFTHAQLQVATHFFDTVTSKVKVNQPATFYDLELSPTEGYIPVPVGSTSPVEERYEGKDFPYRISSVKGGFANFRNFKKVQKYAIRRPILDVEVRPVKEFWSERFFKEKGEEVAMSPLLWENLIRTDRVLLSKKLIKDVLNYQVLKVFRDSRKVNPKPLKELLRLKGMDVIVPPSLLESNYEPSGIFLDILATVAKQDKEVLLL